MIPPGETGYKLQFNSYTAKAHQEEEGEAIEN
jgi:hypothetical protein